MGKTHCGVVGLRVGLRRQALRLGGATARPGLTSFFGVSYQFWVESGPVRGGVLVRSGESAGGTR